MIQITKVDNVNDLTYSYVKCPVCHARLCKKPKNEKVHLLLMSGNVGGKMDHVLIDCRKCKSRYLITLANENM